MCWSIYRWHVILCEIKSCRSYWDVYRIFFLYFCYGRRLFCDCALLAYILETKVNNVIELRTFFPITDATEFLSPLNFVCGVLIYSTIIKLSGSSFVIDMNYCLSLCTTLGSGVFMISSCLGCKLKGAIM